MPASPANVNVSTARALRRREKKTSGCEEKKKRATLCRSALPNGTLAPPKGTLYSAKGGASLLLGAGGGGKGRRRSSTPSSTPSSAPSSTPSRSAPAQTAAHVTYRLGTVVTMAAMSDEASPTSPAATASTPAAASTAVAEGSNVYSAGGARARGRERAQAGGARRAHDGLTVGGTHLCGAGAPAEHSALTAEYRRAFDDPARTVAMASELAERMSSTWASAIPAELASFDEMLERNLAQLDEFQVLLDTVWPRLPAKKNWDARVHSRASLSRRRRRHTRVHALPQIKADQLREAESLVPALLAKTMHLQQLFRQIEQIEVRGPAAIPHRHGPGAYGGPRGPSASCGVAVSAAAHRRYRAPQRQRCPGARGGDGASVQRQPHQQAAELLPRPCALPRTNSALPRRIGAR